MSQINRGDEGRKIVLRIRIRMPSFAALGKLLLVAPKTMIVRLLAVKLRWRMLAAVFVILLANVYNVLTPFFTDRSYALGSSETLLPESSQQMADKVSYSQSDRSYSFNANQTPTSDQAGVQTRASATAFKDATKGISVTDPTNKISFSMKPEFQLQEGRRDKDRIIYPLRNGTGWAVYTMRGVGVKEDIVLTQTLGDTASYAYKLDLGDSLNAKLESDGSLGVYGNMLLSGKVSTGSDKDAQLLQKARKNAPKNTLLFSIPAPTVSDAHGPANGISAKYTLHDNELTVTVTGLKQGNYPLTIDPSIFVVSAMQFMAGNNETNVNFDIDNKLIKKGRTTGARFDSWSSTTSLPTAEWGGSTVAAGGYIYSVGGQTASSTSSTVNWASLNTTTGAITAANPGTGACSTWCSNSAYNLPDGRTNFSLVAYNGYLYVIGGTSSNCTISNGNGSNGICDTVYIAKLGANGEPRLWHPTSANTSTWVYWYRDADLPYVGGDRSRAYTGAVAYNNHLYLMGGQQGVVAGSTTTAVDIFDITPTGVLSWSTRGSLPSTNQYGPSIQVYNDRLYVIGGSSSPTGAPTNSVYYSKINSDGTINSWIQTSSFSTGRMSSGSNFSTIWNGYIYISGGCSAVNASGYCTTTQSDAQVASINADGSLDAWISLSGVSDARLGHSLVAWRDYIYEIGGCSAQNTSTGDCNSNVLASVKNGKINQDGDVSTVTAGTASGGAPCSGTTPTNCNFKASTMMASMVINGGYLYVMGGCTNTACTTTSGDVSFTTLSANGDLVQPATCPAAAPASGGWCVQVNAFGSGRAAMSVVSYYGYAWFIGGITGAGINDVWLSAVYNSDGTISGTNAASLSSIGATAVSSAYVTVRANPSSTTSPGNLYIFGGCTTNASGASCSNFTGNVYKCNMSSAGALSSCSTTSQLQLGTATGATGAGLAIASGTVYSSYIYLIGGSAPGLADTNVVRYAKFDNNNNVVTAGSSGWTESSQTLSNSSRYGSAVGYNGYLYYVGGISSSTIQNTISYIKINTTDGSLDPGGWKTSAITITGRWGLTTIINGGYMYTVGGCSVGSAPSSCSTLSSAVERVKIYNNNTGGPAAWSTSANSYTTARWHAASTIMNGYIYIAGGCTSTASSDCNTVLTSSMYAPIDANGTVGTWANTTAQLPVALGGADFMVAGGTLYLVGGATAGYGTTLTSVYYATTSGGDVTTWNTASNGLPQGRAIYGAAVWNNRMYVVGGNSSSCSGTICGTVYISPQQSSGGNITSAWTSATNTFTTAREYTSAVAYGNTLYIVGGLSGGTDPVLSDVQYAQINTATGDLGSWSYTTPIPDGFMAPNVIAVNGYLYVIGGAKNGSTANCMTTTLVAPISGNTTIASGNSPTGIGNWFETIVKFSGGRYGAKATYNDGKVYTTGGICNSAAASPNIQQSTLLSQPQVAKYSIMFDTDTDVYPSNWLINGIDNSIGARWQLKYRSMTDPTASGPNGTGKNCSSAVMSTWGQETNFGNVTLGLPGIYTPKDSSGATTTCSRYFYLNTTVDSSQAFGYPDDVSRGPTITDMTLRYTSAPSKRLMHGRTFSNGLQMPTDTYYYSR